MIHGIHLHCEMCGAGNVPVVLVHGYSMSSIIWEKVMPLFEPAYRLHAIDLKGFGRSDKPEAGYSCRELADDIRAFMDGIGLERAVLIGHSFGSLVLQHFAAAYPGRVGALVLCNALAAVLPPKGLTPFAQERLKGYGSIEDNRKIFSANMQRYFDTANVLRGDIDRLIEVGLQACTTALRDALVANYTTPAIPPSLLEAVRVPVLILVTTHDPFGTFDQAVAISDSLPNSRIAVIERCGHSPMWEKPLEFVRIVTAFLRDAGVQEKKMDIRTKPISERRLDLHR